jgi:hypothetical protein
MTGLKLNEPDRTDAEAMFRLESSGGEEIDMTPYCGDDTTAPAAPLASK